MSSACRLEQLLLMKKGALAKSMSSPRVKGGRAGYAGRSDAASKHGIKGNRDRRRYVCPKCPYATDRRDLFTRHENIHRDEKPFRCYVCNKMFNRADHVKKHFIRIHKGMEYDVKLTKRIRGVDYDAENSPTTSVTDQPNHSRRESGASLSSRSFLASQLVNCLVDTNQRIIRSESPHRYLSGASSDCQLTDGRREESPPLRPVQCLNARQLVQGQASEYEGHDDMGLGEETADGSKAMAPSPSLSQHDESTSSSSSSRSASPTPSLPASDFRSHRRSGDTLSVDVIQEHGSQENVATKEQDVAAAVCSKVRVSTEHECEECGATFADFPSLHTHRYLLHRISPKEQNMLPYRCASCGYMTCTQKAMVSHMTLHYSRTFPSLSNCNRSRFSGSRLPNRRKQVAPRKLLKSALSLTSEDIGIQEPSY